MTLNLKTLSGLQNTYLNTRDTPILIAPATIYTHLKHRCFTTASDAQSGYTCADVNIQQCFLAKCIAMSMVYRSTHRTITSSLNTNKRKSKYKFCAALRYSLYKKKTALTKFGYVSKNSVHKISRTYQRGPALRGALITKVAQP
jgi:hypothetical protein